MFSPPSTLRISFLVAVWGEAMYFSLSRLLPLRSFPNFSFPLSSPDLFFLFSSMLIHSPFRTLRRDLPWSGVIPPFVTVSGCTYGSFEVGWSLPIPFRPEPNSRDGNFSACYRAVVVSLFLAVQFLLSLVFNYLDTLRSFPLPPDGPDQVF